MYIVTKKKYILKFALCMWRKNKNSSSSLPWSSNLCINYFFVMFFVINIIDYFILSVYFLFIGYNFSFILKRFIVFFYYFASSPFIFFSLLLFIFDFCCYFLLKMFISYFCFLTWSFVNINDLWWCFVFFWFPFRLLVWFENDRLFT